MASSKCLIIITLVAIFQIVQCKVDPTIGFISPDIVADIGEAVELVCTVKHGEDHPILWMKLEMGRTKNPVPLSTGTQILFKDSRYKLDVDHAAGTYKLIITNVEKIDGGKYQCQVVTHPETMVTADVDLKVRTSPVINEESDPVISQEAGKTAVLECDADGYPSPKISWKRQDGKLLPNGAETLTNPKMTIPNVQRINKGNYVCTASNGVGTAKERVLDLVVGFAPTIELPRPRVSQAAYYEAHLECHIRAFPQCQINWHFLQGNESNVLVNDGNHFISHYAESDELVISTLKIYSVYKEDFGQYTCEAGNKYGKTSQHLELYESSIPICPPLCGDTDLNSAATITSRENWKAAVSLLTGSAISLFMQRLIMV